MQDLLCGFVDAPWVNQLDFSTLEKINNEYITDKKLKKRANGRGLEGSLSGSMVVYPMCFVIGEFIIGSRDVMLGEIHGCEFYMAADQFEFWKNTHLTIDITEGRGASFLEIPLGLRFITVSRLFKDEELENLRPV